MFRIGDGLLRSYGVNQFVADLFAIRDARNRWAREGKAVL